MKPLPGPSLRLLPVSALPVAAPTLCDDCTGLCCRLTVVLVADDITPATHTEINAAGLRVMSRGESGYCVALGSDDHRCTIYEQRPQACRRFSMGGPYCRAVREDAQRSG